MKTVSVFERENLFHCIGCITYKNDGYTSLQQIRGFLIDSPPFYYGEPFEDRARRAAKNVVDMYKKIPTMRTVSFTVSSEFEKDPFVSACVFWHRDLDTLEETMEIRLNSAEDQKVNLEKIEENFMHRFHESQKEIQKCLEKESAVKQEVAVNLQAIDSGLDPEVKRFFDLVKKFNSQILSPVGKSLLTLEKKELNIFQEAINHANENHISFMEKLKDSQTEDWQECLDFTRIPFPYVFFEGKHKKDFDFNKNKLSSIEFTLQQWLGDIGVCTIQRTKFNEDGLDLVLVPKLPSCVINNSTDYKRYAIVHLFTQYLISKGYNCIHSYLGSC